MTWGPPGLSRITTPSSWSLELHLHQVPFVLTVTGFEEQGMEIFGVGGVILR